MKIYRRRWVHNPSYCKGCDTWQHKKCYYPEGRAIPETHMCVNCDPRPCDIGAAAERQRKLRAEAARGWRNGRGNLRIPGLYCLPQLNPRPGSAACQHTCSLPMTTATRSGGEPRHHVRYIFKHFRLTHHSLTAPGDIGKILGEEWRSSPTRAQAVRREGQRPRCECLRNLKSQGWIVLPNYPKGTHHRNSTGASGATSATTESTQKDQSLRSLQKKEDFMR